METKLLSVGAGYSTLPESYIRPESDRPRLSEVSTCANIPVIDLGSTDRAHIIREIAHACTNYGFFFVVNHEVPKEAVDSMLGVSEAFFKLPIEEKLKLYTEDPTKTIRLSTSFNVNNERVHNWRDFLRFHCNPLENYVSEWPSNPPSFKEIVSNYCNEIRNLGYRLEDLISESLGLETNHIRNVLGEQTQIMSMNLYPPCPQPELTYGLPAHTDPHALTVLLPDPRVTGLQVLKDGKWLAVNPIPGAFAINLGDQLQALSNERYKSVWHRVIVNRDEERISIGCFLGPSRGANISAPTSLIHNGSKAVYRDYTYAEYYDKFFSGNLDLVPCLESFKNK